VDARFAGLLEAAPDAMVRMRMRSNASASSHEPAAEGSLPSGTETILLVDDEPLVCDLTARFLRLHGYNILEAHSASEALAIQAEREGAIDLLLTDVMMPVMGGEELARRIRQNWPDTKVLYMSGYTHATILDRGVLKSNVALLTKPFSLSALAHKVREVLNNGTTQ